MGLYYSVIDWRHPDFPHYGDMHHPMRNHPECSNENRNFDNYLEYMFGQIKELLTDYGKLDVMWFDFSYGNMKCDTWKAKELIEMVRSIQPDVIIDNRLEGSGEDAGSIRTLDPTPYSGADDSSGGYPGRRRESHSLGGLHYPEQPLGLCCS